MWRRVFTTVWTYLRRSPLTFIWLAVLLATTSVQHAVSPQFLDAILVHRSTNIDQLTTDPLRVIVMSLWWLDGGGDAAYWFPYAISYVIFHAPAERWLGSFRWLAIGFTGHVIATFVSEGALALAIRDGIANGSMRDTQDVGVSYFLATIVAVLTYHIARPWRWAYLAGVLVSYAVPLLVAPTFTALGHFSSVLIGLACYPVVRGKTDDQWDPAVTVRRLIRRWRHSSPEVSPVRRAC
ncbi:hypothetical protein HH308_05890 [Gordonia sp. TBRC 11910]|uniref:Rhomboid family protein n=1 Tax=Gordonia asplenii TaxID=2725283 RepID=A0A848KV57_9ACTN|nr:rhomboid-like protein [Gordonia asplenii]NMO00745.1 hypothetical protein [Gordonia asplenii]